MAEGQGKAIVNIADVPLNDHGNGDAFAAKVGRVSPLLGLQGLGCSIISLPPGKRAYPFHRHHTTQEMFYILSARASTASAKRRCL